MEKGRWMDIHSASKLFWRAYQVFSHISSWIFHILYISSSLRAGVYSLFPVFISFLFFCDNYGRGQAGLSSIFLYLTISSLIFPASLVSLFISVSVSTCLCLYHFSIRPMTYGLVGWFDLLRLQSVGVWVGCNVICWNWIVRAFLSRRKVLQYCVCRALGCVTVDPSTLITSV